ncbi:MAG: ABC transporter ATP-binding protein [Firmicutes bacterium]|nr:ABC transporter ATP-binding protein [Bacillota bacterium]
MIEIKNVTKFYGKQRAINDISLDIPQGQIIGLFGENGAGKTTLMKSILGFLKFRGEILLDGQPINHKNIDRLAFATSEHSFFPALTAKAHKEFYQMHFKTFRTKRFDGLMEFFQLPMNKPLKSFSVGQQNQFEVILALSQGADYILMDEPFSGNDVFNREDFYKVLLGILEPNETILLSTHLLEEVEKFIDRAVLIHQGALVGDKLMEELEEENKTLMTFVKEVYHYRQDRVSRALSEMTDSED